MCTENSSVIKDLMPVFTTLVGAGIAFYGGYWTSKQKEKSKCKNKIAQVITSIELDQLEKEFLPEGIIFPIGQAVNSLLLQLKGEKKEKLNSLWNQYKSHYKTMASNSENEDIYQSYLKCIRAPGQKEEALRILKELYDAI